jgi:hypothetical protein
MWEIVIAVCPFGVFSGHLIILWSFGIFFIILVCFTKKNLATLQQVSRHRCPPFLNWMIGAESHFLSDHKVL